ncbi:hypothetical protein CDD80_6888 [Ophiocordyceps camponoti-rufipedis]|uniref:Uncharacterized protein n=1 Tax=Ophiocordyceps camponoti-rufipedis TaxID=2004952 RepID=A0A2C5YRT9_9HYPO|nr:hypothetical protein CDD80_6888 [Ophiocordyceps camponoti-rufipedis]
MAPTTRILALMACVAGLTLGLPASPSEGSCTRDDLFTSLSDHGRSFCSSVVQMSVCFDGDVWEGGFEYGVEVGGGGDGYDYGDGDGDWECFCGDDGVGVCYGDGGIADGGGGFVDVGGDGIVLELVEEWRAFHGFDGPFEGSQFDVVGGVDGFDDGFDGGSGLDVGGVFWLGFFGVFGGIVWLDGDGFVWGVVGAGFIGFVGVVFRHGFVSFIGSIVFLGFFGSISFVWTLLGLSSISFVWTIFRHGFLSFIWIVFRPGFLTFIRNIVKPSLVTLIRTIIKLGFHGFPTVSLIRFISFTRPISLRSINLIVQRPQLNCPSCTPINRTLHSIKPEPQLNQSLHRSVFLHARLLRSHLKPGPNRNVQPRRVRIDKPGSSRPPGLIDVILDFALLVRSLDELTSK